jgi:hypothetical protein
VIAAQDAQIRDLSTEAFGRPESWPAPDDGASAEAAVRAALADSERPVRVIDVDCSEPPCLSAVDVGTDWNGRLFDVWPNVNSSVGAKGYSLLEKTCPNGTTRDFIVVETGTEEDLAARRAANAWPEIDPDTNEETRIRVRTKDLQTAFSCP